MEELKGDCAGIEICGYFDDGLAVVRLGVGDVGKDDLMRPAVGADFRRLDDQDTGGLDGPGADDAAGFQVDLGGGPVVLEGDPVVVFGVVVVEVGQGKGEGVVLAGLVVEDGVVVPALGDTGIALHGGSDAEEEAVDQFLLGQAIGERLGEEGFHGVVVVDDLAVLGGVCDEHALIGPGGLYGAGEGGVVAGCVVAVEVQVFRGGDFAQAHMDGGIAGCGDVVVLEAPLLAVGWVAGQEGAVGDNFDGACPGVGDAGIPLAVSVEVLVGLAGVPRVVLVGVDEGFEAGSVAVAPAGVDVVVGGVGICDPVPDFLDGRIGAHDDRVTGAADGVVVVFGEAHLTLRALGVVVEGLGESIVDGGLVFPLEEGAGTEDVEPFF